jgi:hypothetical protein
MPLDSTFASMGNVKNLLVGLILVDPPFQPKRPSGLKEAGYRRFVESDRRQCLRTSLSHCISRNKAFASPGIPVPFELLQDFFRLLVSEWNNTATYFGRDLNTIEWALEGRHGSNNPTTPEKFEEVLKKLFVIRRRLNRCRDIVESQRSACGGFCKATWARKCPSDAYPSPAAVKIATELQVDYTQTVDIIAQNVDRMDQSIRLLTSLMATLHGQLTVEENKRSGSQNKILTVLTFVATFFLPINAISAILNMQGDWAPLQPKFGMFWGISIPVSVSLVLLLLVMRCANPARLCWPNRRDRKEMWAREIV